jgi:hypothetical protein
MSGPYAEGPLDQHSGAEGWEARMAERARRRSQLRERPAAEQITQTTDRAAWPVPEHLKGYSGRDCYLWYVADGYRRIFGRDLDVIFDHDFGYHVLSDGVWQLTLVSLDQFPGEKFGGGDAEAAPPEGGAVPGEDERS